MKESEIRPAELFNKYLDLSYSDGEKLDKNAFVEVPCPCCNSVQKRTQLEKNGYSYKKCENCNSLFCSPRPSESQLNEFYFSSESSRYWSEVFFPSVRDARIEKMFKPKAKQICDMLEEQDIKIRNICDIGAGHGLFLQEIGKLRPDLKLFAVEPDSNSCKECSNRGIEVLQATCETAQAWENKFDLVICSEVIEHVFDPLLFVASLMKLVAPGGYCLVTGLGYEGFDILTLQNKSKSIFPPHHLNFLSINGFEKLFTLAGFTSVEVWTPGKLDVDIVLNSGEESEFLRVLKLRGEEAVQDFQRLLVKHRLSSHTWILSRK